MIPTWISVHDPKRVFLTAPSGRLRYGELVLADGETSALVVETLPTLDTIQTLMSAGHQGRRLVLIDPQVAPEEKQRRRRVAVEAGDRDFLTLLFTSGTTGPPRGVRLTVDNWSAAVEASRRFLDHTPEDVWLAPMPLHHVGGLAILYRSAYVGAQVRWLPRFDTVAVARALREDVTIASVVPTMLRRLLDHDRHTYTNLKAVLVGGGPIPPGILEEAHARGIPALPTYGMTETCAQVATLRPGSGPRYAVHPLPGIDLRIDQTGRIQVAGRQVSPGYADEDDRHPDDWFTTADLGALDEDGALRVLGRADRIIVTGGENVDPARVELTLMTHPAVTSAAVVGVEDREWGEVVVGAYEGDVEADALRDWLRDRLPAHEVPKRLVRYGSLPTTGGGKPDLALISARLTGDQLGESFQPGQSL